MLGVFDQDLFAELLKKALGPHSAYRYAKEVSVSRGHISLLLGKKTNTPPTPETISKLASKAYNNITYDDLMMAAGHIAGHKDSKDIKKVVVSDIDESKHVTTFSNFVPAQMREEFDKLGFELVSLVHDNNITLDELKELLVMLRALKEDRKKK